MRNFSVVDRFRAPPSSMFRRRFKGLSTRIYGAFLLVAVVPVSIAGLVGIYFSLDALKAETLHHLRQEVGSRSVAIQATFDQISSQLRFLAQSSHLRQILPTAERSGDDPIATKRETIAEFSAFVSAFPDIYQLRLLDRSGRETVRVDRRDGRIVAIPDSELQDKSDRYYVQRTLAAPVGSIYISALDLNIEQGVVETPPKPVIRFSTPIAGPGGTATGMLIINLHAELVLRQIQDMAGTRGGTAYLFDRSGYYLAHEAAGQQPTEFSMQPVSSLPPRFPAPVVRNILEGNRGNDEAGEWIISYAPVGWSPSGRSLAAGSSNWELALAFPKRDLFRAVVNLYLLYGALAACLLVTAAGGYMLSRHLLRPLLRLREETESIAQGNFSHRLEVKGDDEIADLSRHFNAMAQALQASYASLEARKQTLEQEVQARTAALERERRYLDAIIRNTTDGILVAEADGTIELANAGAERLLGGGSPLVGRKVAELWPAWAELEARAREPGSAGVRNEHEVAGRRLTLDLAPINTADSRGRWVAVVQDVTQERALELQRRELDRQMFQMEKMTTMGELAMGLAHEIGNPLTGMKTVTQVLLDEPDISDHVRTYLGRIEREIDRLYEFLGTFKGFAAPRDHHPKPCLFREVLDDVLLWTRKEAKTKNVAIRFDSLMPATYLWADPNQLKQVLINVLINAIHALETGGEIVVRLEALGADSGEAARVRFCVEDNGTGIPAEVVARIFEPFFTTREGGSGLGLAVVRNIVQQHGAEVRVDSAPGRGTRFCFDWPTSGAAGDAQ